MKHYVYKITDPETNHYYFGSRSCEVNVEEDIEYMGSMKTWKPEDETRLLKEIIKDDFKTREEAIEFESSTIEEHIDDELNENYHIPNKGFHTFGSNEVAKKISKANKGKAPWNFGKVNVYSDDTLEKMSNSAKGRIFSKKTRNKISKANTGKLKGEKNPMYGICGDKNPNYGNSWTDEMKNELSKKFTGKVRGKTKSVLQYDLDGKFIKEWKTIKSACNSLNLRASGISSVLSGRYKQSGGYMWEYKNKEGVK